MRVLLSAGGTGGHTYPGLVVAGTLPSVSSEPVDLLWVGRSDGLERELVCRAGVPFQGIDARGVHGLGLRQAVPNSARLLKGIAQAWKAVGDFGPDVCFVTGGYVSVPATIAAWMRRVPVLVYLPDIEPGQAVRLISRFARRVAVTAEQSRAYFPSRKVVVTGYPIRHELGEVDRDTARQTLGLRPDVPTLLVMGGSLGAQSINRAVTDALADLLAECQIIHISGSLDAPWVSERRDALPEAVRSRYRLYPYLHSGDLGRAMASADLVVDRAGAATMGELPAMGLPGILVPYPYYWRYQKVNADYLVGHGAAVRLEDERLGIDLVPTVRRLLADEGERKRMGARAKALARPEAAHHIARELLQLGRSRRN